MDELTAVRAAVSGLLVGAIAPLHDLLADDVELEVASAGDAPGCRKHWGKQAVADYFVSLGDLPAFWRMEYSAIDGRVIAWGDESFTVEGCGLEGETEFALVFDIRQGRVTRLLVIEDMSFIPGWDFAAASVPAVPADVRRRSTRLRRVPGSGDAAPTAAFAGWNRDAVALADAPSEHVGARPSAWFRVGAK